MDLLKTKWRKWSLEAKIILSYRKEKEANAVAKAVSPDNMRAPQGLFIKTKRRGYRVYTTIKCQTKFKTFIATIDDLLRCVSIAEKAFSVV